MPIDWHTLGLQLGALLVILISAIAGFRGVARRRKTWLSIVGLGGSHIASRITGQGERFAVFVLVLTAAVCALLIGRLIFQDCPCSGDEWSYFLQADIFSRGRLQVDSPAYPQFFDVWGMVNNGKFYAWAPPGWPLLLAPGILLRAPWLVNPAVGALTLLAVYRLGKLVYDGPVALLAVCFMLFSPFFLLHSASYFAHPSSLLFITLCVFFYARGLDRGADGDFLLAGLCGSASFLIRPFDQVIVLCPLGAYLLFLVLRRQVAVRQVRWFGMGHALGVLLLLGYNVLQTGHPLTMGYHVGYSAPLFDLHLPGRRFIAEYFLHLLVWTFPFVPLVALLYSVWLGESRSQNLSEQRWDALLFLVFLSTIIGYAFVPFHYWVGYGPRYYYGSFFAVALLAAKGTMALLDLLKGRWSPPERIGLAAVALGSCVALSLGWPFPTKLAEAYQNIKARQALYRLVKHEQIENAVIFIRAVSGEYLPWNLTRNRPDFQGTVLYVHDLGPLNHLLMRQYPGRTFFLYEYDESKEPILQHLVLDDAGG